MENESGEILSSSAPNAEIQNITTPEVVEQHEVEESTEQRAKKFGHLSKEEWESQGKDPKDWKTPEEFDRTGKLIDEVYALRKKIERREDEISNLVVFNQRVAERERAKALQELQARLVTAKQYADVEGVEAATKDLQDYQNQQAYEQRQQQEYSRQKVLTEFQERNAHWYNASRPDLQARAVEIDNQLRQLYPHLTFAERALKIEERVNYEHPELTKDAPPPSRIEARPLSSAGSAINKAVSTARPSVQNTFNKLNAELKEMYYTTKRVTERVPGVKYTIDDYVTYLKDNGEI
jgi:hypothetical protein